MNIALALIVKGTPEEAKLLDRCLENAAPFVDGLFITITQPSKEVEKVATRYHAHVSHFTWVNDFAAARNFNFSQVPKDYDYILWCDADDMFRGLENLRPTLEAHPHVDAFGMWYLYDWDEFRLPTVVHRKTMLIKNNGCAKWVGALHEDLEPTRQLDVQLLEGIERCHLTNADRAAENAKRNVTIATAEVEKDPDDPRTYWNLANSQFAVSDYTGAEATFQQFLRLSESTEERYLAYERLADVAKAQDKSVEAIAHLQHAIGLQPMLPDAYLQLGHLYYTLNDWENAEKYVLMGIVKRPQIHQMIVFNPRDYDYNPMMLLAKIYYQKSRPDLMLPMLKGCLKIYPKDKHLKDLVKDGEKEYKAMEKALKAVQRLEKITDKEKLRKAIEKLPEDVQSHPHVCVLRNTHFIKEASSGRDLVIYCGNTTHQWNPELFKTKGFGGSEEAVINLSREFAKLGWKVTVYNNCGHKEVVEQVFFQQPIKSSVPKASVQQTAVVTYKPFWEWNYRDKQDVVILWRWAKPLDFEINAPKVFVDLHDVVPKGEFTPERLKRVTKIFVKTKFHRSLFPNVPDEKIAVIPNGMDFATLESDPPIEKDPYLIINTSSPDRSMDVLPKLFKEVKKRVPQARLQWAYGWDVYKSSYARDPKKIQWMKETQKAMDEAGIETLGRLTQAEVGKLYQRASYFAYPTEFAEIDCISVKKAQAAACYPVTTDFGALPESNAVGARVHSTKTKDTWSRPYQFHFGLEDEKAQQEWVDKMVQALELRVDIMWKGWMSMEAQQKVHDQARMTGDPNPPTPFPKWLAQFRWENVAARWDAILKA